ncbi:hypothetical protein CPC08DRAFT_775592 [Agrocybe pediades]|nr:hypothetical protein CPC08DRAFT_775592 [Agrocybe pediades]
MKRYPTGKPNSWVEVDLVQEHLNFWIKSFYKAHGSNASWEWLKLISPCTRHAEPQLQKDIESLMKYLSEHNVYKIQKGGTLDDDEPPVKDVITAGFHSLTTGVKNPLSEYNDAFARLQRRRRMKPVTEMRKTSSGNAEPTAPREEVQGEELTGPELETLNQPPTMRMPDSDARVSEDNPFVEDPTMFELAEDEAEEEQGEIELILEDLENGVVEDLFPALEEGDVALDMDDACEEMSDDDSDCGSDED